MPHNQTIDGVPRAQLADIADRIEHNYPNTAKELRALLDANPEENVPCPECGGSLVTWGCTCTPRWPMYKPAAQPQGEPIKRYNTTVSHGGSYEHVVLEEHKNGHVIKAVDFDAYVTRNYAEQPEPVAAVTYQQVFKAYEYAEAHPHKYLRGTTNWCAAVAYALNAQKPLTAVKGDPGA